MTEMGAASRMKVMIHSLGHVDSLWWKLFIFVIIMVQRYGLFLKDTNKSAQICEDQG